MTRFNGYVWGSVLQVIAVAMDIFTDVDIFADLLEAAMRNVAVYILLDDQNAHHFTDMVAHCRVDLNQIKVLESHKAIH